MENRALRSSICFLETGDLVILQFYELAKKKIGEFKCNGKEIDNDTTVIHRTFHVSKKYTFQEVEYVDGFHREKCLRKVYWCNPIVFCKCGAVHLLQSDLPSKIQMQNIVKTFAEEEREIDMPDVVIPREGDLITCFTWDIDIEEDEDWEEFDEDGWEELDEEFDEEEGEFDNEEKRTGSRYGSNPIHY